MSDAAPSASKLVTELKVSAHLMQLDAGVYCIYNQAGSSPPDPVTGLPGARLTLPPGQDNDAVTITGFRPDGWLGAPDGAALVRVTRGTAQVLMTIYQDVNAGHEPPRLSVTKLVEGPAATDLARREVGEANMPPPRPAAPQAKPQQGTPAEIAAHLQQHGDVLGRLGQWVGERGSQLWVEGFAVSPQHPDITPADIEYQAVLGRGWLSPWAEGGQYCGSRGMALPILGLRARLRGKAAETLSLEISATFTDGTAIGPVGPGDACEAESLAPLEAFCITVAPLAASVAAPAAKRVTSTTAAPVAPRRAPPPPPPAKAVPAAKPKPAGRPAAATPAPATPTRGRRS